MDALKLNGFKIIYHKYSTSTGIEIKNPEVNKNVLIWLAAQKTKKPNQSPTQPNKIPSFCSHSNQTLFSQNSSSFFTQKLLPINPKKARFLGFKPRNRFVVALKQHSQSRSSLRSIQIPILKRDETVDNARKCYVLKKGSAIVGATKATRNTFSNNH